MDRPADVNPIKEPYESPDLSWTDTKLIYNTLKWTVQINATDRHA